MNKKAEMGIGTLIIFIAMILVAAIAAAVLIQTATSLQNKALLTGERSKSQISTSITPILMYVEDGTDGFAEFFFIKIKLSAGSDAIKIDDTLIEFDLKNASSDLTYNSTITDCSLTNETNNTNNYFIQHLIQGTNFRDGYLQRGDVVKLCFEAPRAVTEDETVGIAIIPKIGSPLLLESAMPDIMTDMRVTIYP